MGFEISTLMCIEGVNIVKCSGGKTNPDLLLFYQKRTNESETAKQITKHS